MEISAVATSVISADAFYGTNYSDTKSWSFADALRDWAEKSKSIFSSDSISDEPSKCEFKNFRVYNENGELVGGGTRALELVQQIAFVEELGRQAMGLKPQTPVQTLALGRAMGRTSAWDDRALWNLY